MFIGCKDRLNYRKCDTPEAKERIKKNMRGSFFHILFIIIYVVTMGFEIPKGDSFLLNEAVQEYFTSDLETSFNVSYQTESKTFSTISCIEDVYSYLDQVYFPKIYSQWNNSTTNSSTDSDINTIYTQTVFIGDPLVRMTLRKYQMTQLSNLLFVRTTSDTFDWDDSQKPYENTTNSTYPGIGISMGYTTPGTIKSPNKVGGFVFTLPRNFTAANNTYSKLVQAQFIDADFGTLVLETILYNPNIEMYGDNLIIFEMNTEGDVVASIEPAAFKMIFYSNRDGGRIIFELLYLIAIILQTRTLILNWISSWKDEQSRKETLIKPDLYKPGISRLSRFLNFNLEANDISYCGFIYALFKRIWQLLNRLYVTTKLFITSQYTNLLLSISIILTITALIELLLIVFDPFRLSFNIQDVSYSTYTGESLQGDFERVAQRYNDYVTLQAFNAFFLVMRLLLVFRFSGELSIVLDLISDALLDFVFFILMSCLIMFGFATIGYLNFGAEDLNFHNITRSMLTCVYVLVASVDMSAFSVTDTAMLVIWVFSYMILMALILLNMFIAILEGYFRQIAPKGENEQIGFLDLLKFFVISEFKRIEELKKEKQLQYDKEKAAEQRKQKKLEKIIAVNVVSLDNVPGMSPSNLKSTSEANRNEQDELAPRKQSDSIAQSPEALIQRKTQTAPEEESNDLEPEVEVVPQKKKSKCQRMISAINSKLEDIWFALIDFIFQKIVKKFVFTDQQAESEDHVEPPQITAKIEFQEKRNDAEENLVLKDIEFYLGKKDDDIISSSSKDPEAKAGSLEDKNDGTELQKIKKQADEEKELTNKWVNSLEETLLKLSGGKINIINMGTNTKDYLFNFGSYSNHEIFKYEEALSTMNEKSPRETIDDLAIEAAKEYKEIRKLLKRNEDSKKYYEKLCFKIELIIYVSDKANKKRGLATENDIDIENEEDKPEKSDMRFKNRYHVDSSEEDDQQQSDDESKHTKEKDREDESEEEKEGKLDNKSDEIEASNPNPGEMKFIRTSKKSKTLLDQKLEELAHEKILEIWNLFTISQQ